MADHCEATLLEITARKKDDALPGDTLPEVADYSQEVANGYEFHDGDKQWAWNGLAQVSITRADYHTAEQQALKSLELSRSIESPEPLMQAYDVLDDVY
jgi:hypothetical protein